MKKVLFLIIFIFTCANSYADNKIAYIDINHILNNSLVGQSISKHILDIKEKKQVEFSSIEKKLSDKEKDIINKKNIVEKKIFDDQVKILKEEIKNYRNKKNEFNNKDRNAASLGKAFKISTELVAAVVVGTTIGFLLIIEFFSIFFYTLWNVIFCI